MTSLNQELVLSFSNKPKSFEEDGRIEVMYNKMGHILFWLLLVRFERQRMPYTKIFQLNSSQLNQFLREAVQILFRYDLNISKNKRQQNPPLLKSKNKRSKRRAKKAISKAQKVILKTNGENHYLK